MCHSTRFYELLVELRMASHTIVVDDVLALCNGFHGHRLIAHSEYIRVPQSVFCLEEVLVENVVVRYVTVVAGCHILVRAVLPSGVVGRHNMAVDAGTGIV